MGNSEGFDPLYAFVCSWISQLAYCRARDPPVLLQGSVWGAAGGAASPAPPSPFSNRSPLNQLSENDRSHPGSLLESSLILKWDTNNPELQLRMMYMLTSIAQLTILGFACVNFWIQNIPTQRETPIWHMHCRSSLSLWNESDIWILSAHKGSNAFCSSSSTQFYIRSYEPVFQQRE